MRVLIVEDEPKLAGLIRSGLRQRGFAVDNAASGEDALWMAGSTPYDAIVLDVMLPGIDGFETCRRIRADEVWSPILMLTARDAVEDRVGGLECGADDYLTKPFYVEELIARLHAVIRRGSEQRLSLLQSGDLVVDLLSREVRRGERAVSLTTREFSLLEYLMRSPGRVVPRTQLLEQVWGYDFDPGSNVVDVCVQRLRRKIDPRGDGQFIETVRGVGYRFRR